MSGIVPWILAGRPKTLPAAVVPVWVGCVLAYALYDTFCVWLAIATAVSAGLIQIATNFFNDAIDFDKGFRYGETVGAAPGDGEWGSFGEGGDAGRNCDVASGLCGGGADDCGAGVAGIDDRASESLFQFWIYWWDRCRSLTGVWASFLWCCFLGS